MLTIVSRDCALLEREGGLALLSLTVAERWLRQAQLTPGAEAVCAQPLLIPLRLKVTEGEKQALAAAQSALTQLGSICIRCPARDGARGPFTLKTTKFTNLDS